MGSISYGEGNTGPTTVPNWNTQQQQLFQQLSDTIQSGYGLYNPYSGPLSSPLTTEEQNYLTWATNNNARQKALEQILSGSVPYEIGPEWAENYYSKGIRAPAVKEYEEITLPAIKEAYSGPGYWGGARAEAERKSASDLATSLAAQKAQLMYGEELAGRQAQEAALGRQAQYGPAASTAEANILASAAGLAAEQADEEVAAGLQSWLMEQDWNNPWIQILFQALGLSPETIAQESDSSSYGFGVFNFGGGNAPNTKT